MASEFAGKARENSTLRRENKTRRAACGPMSFACPEDHGEGDQSRTGQGKKWW
jgi:hypothetical protein